MAEIKKISENIYEIPKEGKMLVPGRILASEKLVEKIILDKTLEQIKNVAQLPGIVEKSLAMPDAHQGYGFSVGGVAAFDLKKGIISPGGIGYDINCLTGDSRILTEFGNSLKIEDFEQFKSELEIEDNGRKIKKILFNFALPSLNPEKKMIENKKINLFMSREVNGLYKIRLDSGLEIKSSPEHPFLTKEGMNKLEGLSLEDELAVNLFSGIESNNGLDEKEAIIAKILGYMFGDGTLYRTKDKLCSAAYGTKEDLDSIKKDLERLSVRSEIYSRKRMHKIKTKYGEKTFEAVNHELHIHSKSFNEMLAELGMPVGNKTSQEIKIPEWIKNGSLILKRLFLAGFFGAELSTPKASSKTCFFCPTIDQNKIECLKDNARQFLIDLTLMLDEFGIRNTKISDFEDHINRKGERTRRFRLFIKGEDDMLKLWRNIGFEYNKKRSDLANIASLYILLKKEENSRRRQISSKIKELKKRGLALKEIKRIVCGINERFIERHYENAKQRIKLDFISFEHFKNKKIEELERFGAIFDKIKSIEKIEGKFKVYDFNIEDNHNFIANGFIVSNCGVRLLSSNLTKKEFLKKRKELTHQIKRDIPSGVGVRGEFRLNDKEVDAVLKNGVNWAIEKGYGSKEDKENCEDSGCLDGADPSKISGKARGRGKNQLGTLGAGNHFLEIQEVEKVFDEKTAKLFGLEKGKICVLIHSGSRGLGHQTASDYILKMEKEYGFDNLPDRELVCAPIKSKLGEDYLGAMRAAANFAFTNRHLIMHQVREAFKKHFPRSELRLVYDVAHNIAKFEEFTIKGKKVKLCVHRKGATRSFGPGRKELPKKYQKAGQPIFIPGSMGTYSYVLAGTKKASEISFASTAHGAGRLLSRTYAKNNLSLDKIKKDLEDHGVYIEAESGAGILEEAPEAYKDVNEVVKVSDELGIGKIVARLKPLAVVKG